MFTMTMKTRYVCSSPYEHDLLLTHGLFCQDVARRRRERIEYFKRLDEVSLEKEDVFVI